MRSYRPEELFDDHGTLVARAPRRSPRAATLRMSANPHANGETCSADLDMPDVRDYAVEVPSAGDAHARSRPAGSAS